MAQSDREQIIACYEAMYDAEIRKDTEDLKKCLDESFVLVHMTGVRMNRREFFDAVLDGTLNYYRCRHERETVNVDGNTASLRGDTRVEAAVYGGGKHVWPLRLDCEFIRKEGVWKMAKAVASAY
jgi:ketosteroid isomerase-like protein